MPKGLKPTSSQIVVSFGLSEDNPNTSKFERVDLQLNALDNEVFVVTAVKLDCAVPNNVVSPNVGTEVRSSNFVQISKQDISNSATQGLANPSVFATQRIQIRSTTTQAPNAEAFATSVLYADEAVDTPNSVEYLDIIATPDFYVNILGSGNSDVMSVEGKLYGYRATADSSTYAALVQSELLSQ